MHANILKILAVGHKVLLNIGLDVMLYGHIRDDSFIPTLYNKPI